MLAVLCLVTQSCPTLCHPMDCSLPGFSVHGILQARIVEWVPYPFSRASSQSRNQTRLSCIAGRFFTSWATREALAPPSHLEILVLPTLYVCHFQHAGFRAVEGKEREYGGALGRFNGPHLEMVYIISTHILMARNNHMALFVCRLTCKNITVCPEGKGNGSMDIQHWTSTFINNTIF